MRCKTHFTKWARGIVGHADVNNTPLRHIDVGMAPSLSHGIMVEMHSHIGVSLSYLQPRVSITPDTQVKVKER